MRISRCLCVNVHVCSPLFFYCTLQICTKIAWAFTVELLLKCSLTLTTTFSRSFSSRLSSVATRQRLHILMPSLWRSAKWSFCFPRIPLGDTRRPPVVRKARDMFRIQRVLLSLVATTVSFVSESFTVSVVVARLAKYPPLYGFLYGFNIFSCLRRWPCFSSMCNCFHYGSVEAASKPSRARSMML